MSHDRAKRLIEQNPGEGIKIPEPSLNDLHNYCVKAQSWPLSWPRVENLGLTILDAKRLSEHREKYESGDSIALLEAVSHSYVAKFRIPNWAHEALFKASSKFLYDDESTEDSLDKILKITKKNIRNRVNEERNSEIVFHVWLFHNCFGFELETTYRIMSNMSIPYRRFEIGKALYSDIGYETVKEIWLKSDDQIKNELPSYMFENEEHILEFYVMQYDKELMELISKKPMIFSLAEMRKIKKARKLLFDKAIKRYSAIEP